MASGMTQALRAAFLGEAPRWYKGTIVLFLVLNPVLFALDPYLAGWALVLEFIFTLAMALRCYPLQPGGLLTLEAVAIGMTTPERVFIETTGAIEVVLLLIFMVAGIYFLKDLLRFTFTKILTRVRSKLVLSLLFSLVAAVLSAFLDALTVVAVVLTVASAFYGVYHRVVSGRHAQTTASTITRTTARCRSRTRADLDGFRAFLRSVVMHAAVGTALGGVTTLVGEPQNLLIGTVVGWDFGEFFVRMAPVSLPVLGVGLATCLAARAPALVWLRRGAARWPFAPCSRSSSATKARSARRRSERAYSCKVSSQCFWSSRWPCTGRPSASSGLTVIVLATAFTGITEEHRLGRAFQEALPFTALLVVFFGIVAVIHDQQLFEPLVAAVLALPRESQPAALFVANGVLSAISDNVFVATVYINQVFAAYEAGTIDRAQFEVLAVAINTGTNIPSVATPNGQAAFLFLLTSALAPLIRLSYLRMVVMALPYFFTMTAMGLAAVVWWL